MKRKIIFLLYISLLYSLQISAQFNGSNGDGYDKEELSATTLTNTSLTIMYLGSNGDGYDARALNATTLQNTPLFVLYSGGNGDGYDDTSLNATTLQNTPLFALYSGGNGDGFDEKSLNATTLQNAPLFALYSGGNGDGYDDTSLNATTLQNTQLFVLYSGGNGDGYDDTSLNATTLQNTQLFVLYSGGNGDGFDVDQETGFLNPNQIVDLRIQAKALLQGPILSPNDDGLMNDDLRIGNLIPKISPYDAGTSIPNSDVFNNGGISGTGLMADNIVDWVLVEIRDSSDNTLIVDETSALLQRDGDIVSLDGTSDVILRGMTGNYFITIRHRNHLAMMTQSTIALSVVPTSVDFTNSGLATYGSNARVQLANGTMAMWSGNVNGDTIIQYSGTTPDSPSILSLVLNDPGNFLNFPTYIVNGYNTHDIDMDGNTQYTGTSPDTPIILQNVLIHPGNFLNFSTYQILEQLPEN
ncbi:hypothetical protein [Kordia zhangzhouensis]|uniref:hypothetical protein n=1 Tax=Kordia zhangzhouensis TaxID=1620405 RepID=UPI0012F9A1B9|nr:hypothetical protein [Kordia zhangzhouensis]